MKTVIYANPYKYDELYHHQRKGAHWGVMNGPPYPLNRSQLSSSEKKAESSSNEKGSILAYWKEQRQYQRNNHRLYVLQQQEEAAARKKAREERKQKEKEKEEKEEQKKKAAEEARIQQEKAAEEARIQQEKAAAEEKRIAINSGDLNWVLNNVTSLSDAEINTALNRSGLIQKMKNELEAINTDSSASQNGTAEEKRQKSAKQIVADMTKTVQTVATGIDKGISIYNAVARITNVLMGDDNMKYIPLEGAVKEIVGNGNQSQQQNNNQGKQQNNNQGKQQNNKKKKK